jgi:hypothetical protein
MRFVLPHSNLFLPATSEGPLAELQDFSKIFLLNPLKRVVVSRRTGLPAGWTGQTVSAGVL